MSSSSATAYAIIAGARLLRRCGTHSSGRCGTVVVDRSSALSNLVAEIDPRQGRLARDPCYRGVLAILLQDLQDAANRRTAENGHDTQISINIMSRLHAVDLLEDDAHISHTWQPHMLVEEARNQGVFVCLFACVFVWLFVCLFVCVFVCLLGAGAGAGALFGSF